MTKILVALLFVLVFVFSIHNFGSINQDIGRHLALGKIIWETKEVPKANLFSYTNPDFPFINHHWLGEVFLYISSLAVGLKGLIVLKAIVITAAFALAFFAVYPIRGREGTQRVFASDGTFMAIIVGLISTFILIERTDVRPEIISFLFLGWYLFVLFRKADSKLIWTLPFIQLLWVNTHIYFFLGPLIFLLFFIGETFKSRNFEIWKGLLIIGLFVVLVNLINPNGLDGALYPLFALNNYGYSIVENQGPFFLKAWGYPWLTTYALFAGVIFTAASFLFNFRNQSTQNNLNAWPSPQELEGSGFRKNIFGSLLFVVSTILAFKMIRNYPIFAMVMVPVSIKNFYEAGVGIQNKKTLLSLSFLLLILIFSVITDKIYETANLGRRFGFHVPSGSQAAVDFVRQNRLRGPIFNNFDVGSFLIWRMPEEKVFIDGRPEAYPVDFIRNVYIPMQEDPEKWKFYSKKYGINYVFWLYGDITPWSQKFVGNMLSNPDWPLVYRDNLVMIFLKK